MKKHLEYLRNGTALVTLFVERSFTGPRFVKRKPAVNMNAAGQIFGRSPRAGVANYELQGDAAWNLVNQAFPSSFPS